MVNLPIVLSSSREMTQLQTLWAAQLNPLLSRPDAGWLLLKNVSLISGDNVINHLLGKRLTGWEVVRMHNQYAQVYDTQDTNRTPELTLVLNSNGPVLVDLKVF